MSGQETTTRGVDEPSPLPCESRLRILFEPSGRHESFFFEEGMTADVPGRITLYFGDADDDRSLALAEKLISAFRSGEGASVDVEGCFTFYHDDEELPPTPFEGVDMAPDWLRPIIEAYRKNGGPSLFAELQRLEGLVRAVTSHAPDSAFDREQNEARVEARDAQDAVLGSRKLMRERLDAAVDALKHYAQGDDSARARAVLTFIGVGEE